MASYMTEETIESMYLMSYLATVCLTSLADDSDSKYILWMSLTTTHTIYCMHACIINAITEICYHIIEHLQQE